MRFGLLIALFSSVAFAQGVSPSAYYCLGLDEPGEECDLLWPSNPYADLSAPPLFSFASPTAFYDSATGAYYAAYAGLPASDGCYAAASVTGTKGEALTFTRATTRFCPTSANEATGVMCASGEVCITSSGTTRGISIFRAKTNQIQRSENITHPSWIAAQAGSGVLPTITGDASSAPDGNTTADRLQVSACAGGPAESKIYQTAAVTPTGANTCTYSAWVKGNGSSGNIALGIYTTAAGGFASTCAYTNGAWKRCSVSASCQGVVGTSAMIGCLNDTVNFPTTASNTGAADVFVWGHQLEIDSSPYMTPYIATEGASATRNAEIAYFAQSLGTTLASGSMAATINYLGGTADTGWLTLSAGDSFRTMLYQGAAANAVNLYVSAASKATRNTTAGTRRLVGYWGSDGTASCVDGTCTTGTAATESATLTRIRLLTYSGDADGSRIADGFITDVCIDPSPTRCR